MKNLELKVPPLFLFLITALLMWLISLYLPSLEINKQLLLSISFFLMTIGSAFALIGVNTFKQSKTTVNPTKPQEASTLVIHGIYKRTRNPMYVGILILLVAWAVFLSNLYTLILVIAFVLYMNRFQIEVEERFLALKFSSDFEKYKKSVPRWL